jgi:hypothetical protein
MKELRFKQNSPQGEIKILIRIIGKIIYIKTNNNQYSDNMLRQLSSKGAIIIRSRNWLKIDLFGNIEIAKLGTYEINLKEESDKSIEKKIADFYTEKYISANFIPY